MASEKKKLLDALICEKNAEQLEALKGILTIDYEAIEQHCKRSDLPDEIKHGDAVLMAYSVIEPVNLSKLSISTGLYPKAIIKITEELSLEIEEQSQKNKDHIAKALNVADVFASFDPKTPVEKRKFVTKHVLGQEVDEKDGTPLRIDGNVFNITIDNRKIVANHVQTGPLNQGKKKALPPNVCPDPEFLDDYVPATEKAVKKLLEKVRLDNEKE